MGALVNFCWEETVDPRLKRVRLETLDSKGSPEPPRLAPGALFLYLILFVFSPILKFVVQLNFKVNKTIV